MATTQKGVDISLREKVRVLQELEQPGESQATVAKTLGCTGLLYCKSTSQKQRYHAEEKQFGAEPDKREGK